MRAALCAALAVLAAAPAFASDKTDVRKAIDQYVQAVNKNDQKTWAGMCADNAVIIDDFAPHVWQGANACSSWWTAFAEEIKQAGITDGKLKPGKAWQLNVAGDHAYVVLSTNFVYKEKGKPTTNQGVWTLSLHKQNGTWKISGWSWAMQAIR